jgi:hypothetical protein
MTNHPAVAARRRRIHAIRVRVAAGAAALFIALFSGLYVQMASGNDPALSATSAQVARATTSSSSSSDTTSSSSGTTTTTTSRDSSPMTTSAS